MSREELPSHATKVEHPRSSIDRERVLRQVKIALGLCGGTDLPPPVRVDRYRIIKRIGRGAFGEVFLAVDERLDRRVAVKLVRPDPNQSPARMVERVYREAKVLGRMSHRNIVHAYDVGEHGDELFIAMEWIDGPSLDRWQLDRARPWRELLSVYLEAGHALLAAHGMGVIHKDFKPSNVLVSNAPPRRVCVIDWGLAREAPHRPQHDDDDDHRARGLHVPTWTVGFTPKYAAPEQMLGEPVGPQADQYAFCVALYEALFGVAPFVGGTSAELLEHKLAAQIVPCTRGRVPHRIEAALRRGMSPHADTRFEKMEALLTALAPRRVRSRWVVGTAAIVGFALGYGLVDARQEPCTGMHLQVEAHWNDDARGEIARAFEQLGLSQATDAFARLDADLEAYLARWVDEAEDACREQRWAAAGSTTGSSVPSSARLACLDRRLETVAKLLGQLRRPSPELVEQAPRLVADLPAVEDCRWATSPPTTAPPDVLEQLERGLAAVEALPVAHQWSAAIRHASELRAQAREHRLERHELEAVLALGRAQLRVGELAEGVRLLDDAGTRAERLRDDVLAWSAWINLGQLGSQHPWPEGEIREWLARAEAAARRIDDDHRLQLLRFDRINAGLVEPGRRRRDLEQVLDWARTNEREDLARASATSLTALLIASDPSRAVETGELAVTLSEAQLGGQHPLTAGARVNLAQAYLQACRLHDADAELRSIASGSTTPPLGLLQVRAMIDLQRGRIDDARRIAEQLGPLLHPAGNEALAWLHHFIGVIEFHEGDLAEAEKGFQRAAELGVANPVMVAVAEASLAEVRLRQARLDEAIELASRARTALEGEGDLASAYLAMPLKVEGLVRLVRGELDAADELLARAEARVGGCEWLERADLDHARGLIALQRGEPGADERLARARTGFGELGPVGEARRRALQRLLDGPD